jgi:5,10-methylenetetrahydromethanopterin reductase
MLISCGVAPGPMSAGLAVAAEELGYNRIFLFDSAAIWEDTFIHLALIAERTTRIGLGTAVLVPTQRPVMTMAAAIGTIARLAPGRLVCAFGTGFTARRCIGQEPMTMASFGNYLRQLKGLLQGATVEVDGQLVRMMHWDEMALQRPIDVPLWISAFGPKGRQLARELAAGLIGMAEGGGAVQPGMPTAAFVSGTVLAEGEAPDSARAVAAVAPWRVSQYHMAYETDPNSVDALPGGRAWREMLETEGPLNEVHLRLHEGHVTHITDRDRPLLPHLTYRGMIGGAQQIRREIAELEAKGITEIIYSPAGPDMRRELQTFMAAANG